MPKCATNSETSTSTQINKAMESVEVEGLDLNNDSDSGSDGNIEVEEEEEDARVEIGEHEMSRLADLSTARGPARQSSIKTALKHFEDFCMSESIEDHVNLEVFKLKTADASWAVIGRFGSYLLAKRKGESLHFTSSKGLKGILGCIRGEINRVCGENFLSKCCVLQCFLG